MKRLFPILLLLAVLLPAADVHAAEAGQAKPGPIPSIQQALIPAITTLVVFVGLLVVLSKTAWGPIVSGLRAREEKIRNDIETAERSRAKAEQTLREYQQQLAAADAKVREIIVQAQLDAEKVATSIRMKAQQEAEEIKERATRDIENARKAAVIAFSEQAATISTQLASKILSRNLNPDDQRELVRSGLEQLQSANAN
jgi:F-type H+-transporting ATPase subunit b